MKKDIQMPDPWTSKVCDLCGGMFVSTENLKRLASKHETIQPNPNRLLIPRGFNEVKKSQENGCKFCKKIWETINNLAEWSVIDNTCVEELAKFRAENPTADWQFNLSFNSSLRILDEENEIHPWTDIEHIIVEIENPNADKIARIAYFEFYAAPGMDVLPPFGSPLFTLTKPLTIDDLSEEFICVIPPVFEVSSPRTFHTAKRWLQNCVANHEKCPSLTSSPLPTRVLDVCPDFGLDKLRLYASKGEEDRYAALSYCWGGPQPIVTTHATLESHQESLVFGHLPNTIQDAIITTRNLDIKYLWIDALCIIQDSLEDKGRELDKMAQIYKDAYVTISASSASSCTAGFLETRTPEIIPERFLFPFKCPDRTMGNVILETQKSRDHWPILPIDTRGWTTQERLLSPRVLLYGDRLSLECQTKEIRNGGHSGHWVGMYDWRPNNPIFMKVEEMNEYNMGRRRCSWGKMVEMYTKRSLTFPEDRLTAFSGVADAFQRAFSGDEYVAGLWKGWITCGLLWSVRDSQPRPKEYRAPSWSWASVDGAITSTFTSQYMGMGGDSNDDLIAMVSCKVDHAPLHRICGGELVLRGKLQRAIWDVEGSNLKKLNGEIVIASGTSIDAIESEGYPKDVYCLHLRHTNGLILQKIGEGTYQRRGYFAGTYNEVFQWFDDCEQEMLKIV